MKYINKYLLFIFFGLTKISFSQDSTGLKIYPTVIASYFPKDSNGLSKYNPFLIGGTAISYKKFYGEIRYNYDQLNTLGIYGGKTHTRVGSKMEHLFTPQLGVLMGDYNGASLQFYYQGFHKNFEINFLNQYSVPLSGQSQFYYNWSGIDFILYKNFRLGVSEQFYSDVQINYKTFDGGISAALKNNNTTIQLYWFNFYDINNNYITLFLQQKISFKKRKK